MDKNKKENPFDAADALIVDFKARAAAHGFDTFIVLTHPGSDDFRCVYEVDSSDSWRHSKLLQATNEGFTHVARWFDDQIRTALGKKEKCKKRNSSDSI
jgi:hypothetical protein